MEKYSSYRDAGTGIQPFLPPVAAAGGSDTLSSVLYPVRLLVATIRTLLILLLAVVYVVLLGLSSVFLSPVPPLKRLANKRCKSILCRLVLLVVGILCLPVEVVHRKKKGRGARQKESWMPSTGDIIVSNWSSWIEVLWLAFRFNPQFILPVCDIPLSSARGEGQKPLSVTPSRQSGTGSAAVSSPGRTQSQRAPVRGFRTASLCTILRSIGKTPPFDSPETTGYTLEELQQKAQGPLVLFPECTTSNCRGLLRFADVFAGFTVPLNKFNIFIMCVRYEPPTPLSPTLSQSIPTFLNPLGHIFTVSMTLSPLKLSVRLLVPSDSPSSATNLSSRTLGASEATSDDLSEACAALVAQTGRLKRLGLGWEDKVAFLDFRDRERKRR